MKDEKNEVQPVKLTFGNSIKFTSKAFQDILKASYDEIKFVNDGAKIDSSQLSHIIKK